MDNLIVDTIKTWGMGKLYSWRHLRQVDVLKEKKLWKVCKVIRTKTVSVCIYVNKYITLQYTGKQGTPFLKTTLACAFKSQSS